MKTDDLICRPSKQCLAAMFMQYYGRRNVVMGTCMIAGYPYSWRTITSICLPYPPFRLATNSADKLDIQIRPRIKMNKYWND